MLRLLLVLFYFSIFKYFILILGSPVFAYLSEKTMSIMRGEDYNVTLAQMAKDSLRGIRLSLRNTVWQAVYLVALILLTLVPVVGWIAPLIALFIECFYYGFSMIDYGCQRIKLSAGSSIHFITHHKGLAIGNGLLFYLMHIFVIAGWILAPAYAVIAATLSLYKVKTT